MCSCFTRIWYKTGYSLKFEIFSIKIKFVIDAEFYIINVDLHSHAKSSVLK